MDNAIKVFQHLQDQYREMGLSVDLIDARAGFTVFNLQQVIGDRLPFRSPTHRLDFFVFVFIRSGKGHYVIDDQRFPIEPGTVYFTNPGHYRSYEWLDAEDAWLVTFDEHFLRLHVHDCIYEEFSFLLTETFPGRRLPSALFAEFEKLYLLMHQEYLSDSPYRIRIIANLFVVLLMKIKAAFYLDYNPIYEGNRGSHIVKDFKTLLEKHYRELGNGTVEKIYGVQDYARLMNLHPNHLSNVIKNKTGKTIGGWIAGRNITEARSLLRNPAIPVKEIAYRLDFAEPAHFSNYFKKHTGMTPAAYRKNHLAEPS